MKHGPSLVVRFTLYPLVLVLFLLVSAYIILISAGYQMRYEDGRIKTQKTGIIIVGTKPGEAKVTIDGSLYPKKTSAITFFKLKINRLKAGAHNLLVERDGYESWEGVVNVDAGYVTWLDYLLLLPNEREQDAYNLPGSIQSRIISSDQKRMLVLTTDTVSGVYSIYQINTENKEMENLFEGKIVKGEKLELLSYSANNARFLYKKTDSNKKTSFVLAEARAEGESTNITNLFAARPSEYYFNPHHDNELYFLSDSNLYKVNVSEKTQSAVLAKDVVGVYPRNKELLMVQKKADNYGLWQISDNGDLKNIVKALPSAKNYDVTYVESQKIYLVHNLDDKDLIIYENGVKNPTLETIAKNVDSYDVAPNGEKVGFYTEGSYKVYLFEKEKYFESFKVAGVNKVDWMLDSANLIYTANDGVYMVNFDGNYNKRIFEVDSSVNALAINNGYNIYFEASINGDKDLYTFSF